MSDVVFEPADSRSVCKFNAGVLCSTHKCGKCGFNPAEHTKRLTKMRYMKLGFDGVRLIDANALKQKQRGSLKWLSGMDLDAAPTIDAEIVTYCKDCEQCMRRVVYGKSDTHVCKDTGLVVDLKDYCSRAKRRESNADD